MDEDLGGVSLQLEPMGVQHQQMRGRSVQLVRQGAVMQHRWTDSAKTFVLSGYRSDNCYSLSVALFRVHNETFNIWSHILGFIFVASCIFRPHAPMCPRLSYVRNFQSSVQCFWVFSTQA